MQGIAITGLTSYDQLTAGIFDAADISAAVRASDTPGRVGKVLLRFPRLFVVAVREG